MTPRRLDPAAVQRRLNEIRQRADQLDEVLPVAATALGQDWRLRAAVEHTFEQLVELAVAVNLHVVAALGGVVHEEYRASFADAAAAGVLTAELAERLGPAASLRNVLVHGYLEIDLEKLAQGVAAAPADFRQYVSEVARWLAALDDST